MDLIDFLDRARALGFRSVEICDRSVRSPGPAETHRIARACTRRGLEIACLDIRNDFTIVDSDAAAAQVAHVEEWIGAARTLGARLARVWGGRGAVDEDAFRRVCKAFRRVVAQAEHCGVRLALENHGGITADADTVIRIIDFVGSPWLGACPDPGWFDSADRPHSLRKVFPYAVHVHAKTHRFDDDGLESEIDYALMGAIARETSYRGLLSVEFEGEGDDREIGILRTVALLKRFFPERAHVRGSRTVALTPAAFPRDAAGAALACHPPPYIKRIRTRSCWEGARSAILPFTERLAKFEETVGVAILGGLADSPHRRFVDRYSDLDLAVFLSVPEAHGYRCPKAFWREHPSQLPSWLPSFQFELRLEAGDRMEVNCHQLIVEVEENPLVVWGPDKQEAYLHTGEVRYDPSGRIARLIAQKCGAQARADRLIVLASQLPWYGWVNPERQLRRGFPENAHLLVNRAAEIVTEILFLLNGRLAPHLKWRFEMAMDLPWLPLDFRRRFVRLIGQQTPRGRIAVSRSLGEEILDHLTTEALIPADPFRYVTLHLDPDRQLCPRTAADRLLDIELGLRSSERRELLARVNLEPLRLSDLPPEGTWSSSSKPRRRPAISRG